jgi:type IV pilus assembly protein PilW
MRLMGLLSKPSNRYGFSLIELLVAMAVSSIVMAGICTAYYSQNRSYITQEQVSAMHQNLRSALCFTEREIRMAGFDPSGISNAGIITGAAGAIRFTLDLNGDGDTNDSNEDITFSLYDYKGDGVNDLGRKDGAGDYQAVAENIDALNFVYLDKDRNVTAELPDVRSVQVTLVARSGRADEGYTDTTTYTNQQGIQILSAQNDHFRRRRLTAEIKCRNLGLN